MPKPLDPATCVGITATVPVEALLAAGRTPVDLNNVFIASGEAAALVEEAERCGFPRNSCAWTKGVYAAARRLRLRRVAAVLLDTGLPGLPVTDEAGVLSGFISRTDILRAVAADPPLDLWSGPAVPL